MGRYIYRCIEEERTIFHCVRRGTSEKGHGRGRFCGYSRMELQSEYLMPVLPLIIEMKQPADKLYSYR